MYGMIFRYMYERIKELIDIKGTSDRKKYREMEAVTGVRSDVWKTLVRGNQRVNEDHINGIAKAYPEYVYWVVTGKTIPEVGQVSPIDGVESISVREAIISILDAKDTEGVMLTPEETADLIMELIHEQNHELVVKDNEAI